MALLCAGFLGAGFGIGVIWAAVITITAAPSPPPSWAADLSSTYETLTWVGGAVMAVGCVGHLLLETDLVERLKTDSAEGEHE